MTSAALPRPQAAIPLRVIVGLLGVACAVGGAVALQPPLVITAVLLAAFATATLIAPDLTTLAVVWLVFANVPGVLVQSHGAPSMLAAGVLLPLFLPLAVYWRRGDPVVVTRVFVLLLLLLLAELGSAALSANQDVALNKLETFAFEAVLLYFLLSNVIRTPELLRLVLWTILLAASFLAFLTVFQHVTATYWNSYAGFALPDPSFAIGKSTEPRASGPIGDPNYYGQLLLVAECVGLVFAWRARTPVLRLIALGSVVVITYAILLSLSRGTLVALFVVLLVMAWLRYFKAWQIATMLLAIVTVLIAVPAFGDRIASVTSVSSAAAQVGSDPSADQSTQGRAAEMEAAFNVFRDHPVLGVGPANFPLYYREYAEQLGGQIHDSVAGGSDKGAEAERQAHNLYLSQLAELGLVGAAVFFVLCGVAVAAMIRCRRACLRARRDDLADLATILLLALIAYLTAGLFLTLAFERYFWMLLGICGAATSVALRMPARANTVR